ncbi:MAG: hypothetical protein HY961_19330 [Ignavibacteriae bacterium]|nr:hypothetical protein [Ignavibacteriota bacterium]
MKSLLVVIAIAVSLFVIGCQENNSPINTEAPTSQSPLVKISSNPQGTLPIVTQLTLGTVEAVDNTYDVDGEMQFSLVATDQGVYSFGLVTSATLRPIDGKGEAGTVYDESTDLVVLPDKEFVLYKKIFRVTGLGEKEADLNVMLAISEDEVKIESVWLSQPGPIFN